MYEPCWEGSVQGYVKNMVAKNLWKFTALGYEFEDLYHEAYLVFAYCKKKHQNIYPTLNENQRRFMALFKQSYHNHFYDLAIKSSQLKLYEMQEDLSEFAFLLKCPGRKDSTSILRNAPKEVKQVLQPTK